MSNNLNMNNVKFAARKEEKDGYILSLKSQYAQGRTTGYHRKSPIWRFAKIQSKVTYLLAQVLRSVGIFPIILNHIDLYFMK